MISKEHDLLERLLRHSVLTLCQETISYEDTLEVDCIICVSVPDSPSQVVVKIHETLNHSLQSTVKPYRKRHSDGSDTSVISCDISPINDHVDAQPSTTEDSISKLCDSFMLKKEQPDEIEGDEATILEAPETASNSIFDGSKKKTQPNDARSIDDMDVSPDTNLPNTDDSDTSLNKGYDAINTTFCSKCDKNFDNFQDFDAHNYSVHLTHTCKYCYQTFTSRPNMHRHIRRHTGYKPFECTICGMRFSRKDDHSIHVIKHSVAKPFVCSMCSKEYTDRSCLRSHMKREHQRRLLYLCSQCGQGFGDPSQAEQHRSVHLRSSGNFHCSQCTYRASSEENLRDHLISHDANSLPHRCSECNESFANLDIYKNHLMSSLQTHHLFPCSLCKVDFPTLSDYQSHHCSTPLGNKIDRIFTYNSSLSSRETSALKRHYWCTECNLGFRVENDLHSHIDSYHCSIEREGEKLDAPPLYIDLCSTGLNRRSDIIPPKYALNSELPTLIELPADTPTLVAPIEFNSNKEAIDLSMGSRNSGDNRTESHALVSEVYSNIRPTDAISNPSLKTMNVLQSLAHHVKTRLPTSRHISSSNEITRTPHKRRCLSLPDDSLTEKLTKITSSQQSPGSFSDSLVLSRSSENSDSPKRDSKFEPKSPTSLFKFQEFYRCDFCPETFSHYSDFAGHCAAAHKRYVCDQCGMCFTAKPNRDRHRRYHTGEKPYSCNLCDKTFFRGDDLKYHRTTRHMADKSA